MRYSTLNAANPANRIDEVGVAAGFPVVGIIDEDAGGVVAYAAPIHAESICKGLNGEEDTERLRDIGRAGPMA